MVLLVRHPCAVVASRMDLKWPTFIPQHLSQPALMEDHLEPLRSHIEGAKSEFEKHVFTWCIQHYVPLRQLARGDVHVMFYENLCVDTTREIERLFVFLGRRFSQRAVRSAALPSTSNWRNTAVSQTDGAELARGWQRRIGTEQARQAVKILELFGLDTIYDESPFPRVNNLDAFLKPTPLFAPSR